MIWLRLFITGPIIPPSIPVVVYAVAASVSVGKLLIGGLMMFFLGLIGEYIGRIYICINNAPQFALKDMINIDEDEEKKEQ